MINYGKRQFIRYVMMGLAFALVSFILGACEAKAEENQYPYVATALGMTINGSNFNYQSYKTINQGNHLVGLTATWDAGGTSMTTGMAPWFRIALCLRPYGYDNEYNLLVGEPIANTNTNNLVAVKTRINCAMYGTTGTYEDTYYTFIYGHFGSVNSETIANGIRNSVTGDFYMTTWYKTDIQLLSIQFSETPFNQYLPEDTILKKEDEILQSINAMRNYQGQIAQNTEDINDSVKDEGEKTREVMTDDSDQDVSSMEGATGWLPQGTIDGLINLPIALVQGITTGLQGSCTPLTLPLPFVNKNMELPCVKTIFDQISGLNVLLNLICTPIMAILLYNYLKNLFQWIQSQIAMEGNSNWGGV